MRERELKVIRVRKYRLGVNPHETVDWFVEHERKVDWFGGQSRKEYVETAKHMTPKVET